MKSAKKTRSSYGGGDDRKVKLNRVLKTLSFRMKSPGPGRTSPISQRHRRFLLRQVISSGGNGVLTRRSFHPTPTKTEGRRLRRTEGIPHRLSMSDLVCEPVDLQLQKDETEYYEETINGIPYKLPNNLRIVAGAGPKRHSPVSNDNNTNGVPCMHEAGDTPKPLRRSPRCQESNERSETRKVASKSDSDIKAEIKTTPPKIGSTSSVTAADINSTPSGPVNQRKRLFPEHIRTAFLNVLPNKKARMDCIDAIKTPTPQRKAISFRTPATPGGLNSSVTPCKALIPMLTESSLVHEFIGTPGPVAVESPLTPKTLPNYMRPTVSSAKKAELAKSIRSSFANTKNVTPMKFGLVKVWNDSKSGTPITPKENPINKSVNQRKSGRENILRKSLKGTPIGSGMRRKTESYLNISAKVGSIRTPDKCNKARRKSSPRLNETFTMEDDK